MVGKEVEATIISMVNPCPLKYSTEGTTELQMMAMDMVITMEMLILICTRTSSLKILVTFLGKIEGMSIIFLPSWM